MSDVIKSGTTKLAHSTLKNDLSTPSDFTPPEELYEQLKATVLRYHPSDDLTIIEKAYKVAADAHEGQKRKSGEPYIIHP
ncbi:MAG: hypothetical protein IJ224_09810, partial [Lachnospiraceae bacterium]|nr:hypothetical protein [Lachnospiraceae bacterium]